MEMRPFFLNSQSVSFFLFPYTDFISDEILVSSSAEFIILFLTPTHTYKFNMFSLITNTQNMILLAWNLKPLL